MAPSTSSEFTWLLYHWSGLTKKFSQPNSPPVQLFNDFLFAIVKLHRIHQITSSQTQIVIWTFHRNLRNIYFLNYLVICESTNKFRQDIPEIIFAHNSNIAHIQGLEVFEHGSLSGTDTISDHLFHFSDKHLRGTFWLVVDQFINH